MLLTTVTLKVESDSRSFDQTPFKVRLTYESDTAWFGFNANNANCPILEYPRFAYVELDRTTEEAVLLRVNSHRARKKMERAIGGSPQACYSFSRSCTGGFFRVSPSLADAALAITGITRAKDGDDIHPCLPL